MNLSTPSSSPYSSDEAYRQAGVDLKKADLVVDLAKAAAKTTSSRAITGDIGGFSGGFELPEGYKKPVLLTACDGVGTKLKLAFESGRHETVGIDLVAMNVNDILASGGEPLVFLDYISTGEIDTAQFDSLINGIAEGCRQAGCALTGGETAEMPGFYPSGEYDLAGFCVGVVEKERMYPRLSALEDGDVLIGLASSGLHSNGYSLARKILFEDHHLNPLETPEGLNYPLIDELLRPTTIYVQAVLHVLNAFPKQVKAMVHVTGGGFQGNIPRVLPDGFSAVLNPKQWQQPAIFPLLQKLGALDDETMWNTFNCGIGFILMVEKNAEQDILNYLDGNASEWYPNIIGHIKATPGRREVVFQ